MLQSIRNHPIRFAIAIGVGAIILGVSIACIVVFGTRQGTKNVSTSHVIGNNSVVTTRPPTTAPPTEPAQPSSTTPNKSNNTFHPCTFFLLNNFIEDLYIYQKVFLYFSGCFDGDALVEKSDGRRVKMKDLIIGDELLVTVMDANGRLKIRPSKLLALDLFQQYDRRSPIHYLEIITSKNTSALHLTPHHSLLVKKKYHSKAKYRFASQVNIGDQLYLSQSNRDSPEEVIVTEINDVELFDAYAPLTMEGNLIVDHLVVSCYGTFSHSFAHFLRTPRRWWLHWYLDRTYSNVNRMLLFLYDHVLFS